MKISAIKDLLIQTVKEWKEDQAPALAASLAYYTIFSLAPMLLIIIGVADLAFDEAEVRSSVLTQAEGFLGPSGRAAVETMLQNAAISTEGLGATILGIALLFLGATTVLVQLQSAMNTIWDAEPAPDRGWKGLILDRVLSLAMIVGIGFLLLVSLVVSAVLSFINGYISDFMPGSILLIRILNLTVSLGTFTVLFAMIFKVVPDVDVAWRDVWVGAAVTAVLFSIGKFAIGLYLGNSSVGSGYGAAGSLVVLLVWVYYSTQLVLFGAEFTHVYAKRHGSKQT